MQEYEYCTLPRPVLSRRTANSNKNATLAGGFTESPSKGGDGHCLARWREQDLWGPPPGLACRWESCRKPTPWSRLPARSVRGRAPPALAHPLPRPYLGDVFYLSGAGGGYKSIISFQRGAARPPFDNPPRFAAFRLRGSSLPWGCKGGSVIAKSMAERAAFIKGGSQRGRHRLPLWN